MKKVIALVTIMLAFALTGTAAATPKTPTGSFLGILCQHENPTADFTCGTRDQTSTPPAPAANTPFWVGVTFFCNPPPANPVCTQESFSVSLNGVNQKTAKMKTFDANGDLSSVVEFVNFPNGLPAGTYSFHWELFTQGQLVVQGTTPVVIS
jgi:hypothetical protein